jgi:hypothetical protein
MEDLIMQTWIADKETLYSHIVGKVRRLKSGRLNYLLDHMTKDDMINDCWIDIVNSTHLPDKELMSMYDGRIVTEWLASRMIRQRVSVSVKNWIDREYFKQKTKMKRESITMKKRYHESIEWDRLTRRNMADVLSSINISKEENIIMLWKMDLIDDKDAMIGLDCSERTLYNRWDKLKDKFREAIVAEPLKSLDLFSRVYGEIRVDMMEHD